MTRTALVKLYKDKLISKQELNFQLKEIDNDMLMAHGGTYNCRKCTYTRHIDCPVYCNN